FIDETRGAGGEVLLTVPTIGWTPIDRTRRWGFSVAKYGPQQQTECSVTGNPPWCQPDAGNGVKPDGTDITGNDPADTSRVVRPLLLRSRRLRPRTRPRGPRQPRLPRLVPEAGGRPLRRAGRQARRLPGRALLPAGVGGRPLRRRVVRHVGPAPAHGQELVRP